MPISTRSLTEWEDRMATEWGKRKIIHKIKIEIEKNCPGNENAISFSLLQVKKKVFDYYSLGSWVRAAKEANDTTNQINQILADPTHFPKFREC